MNTRWTNALAAILLGTTALAGQAHAQAQFNNIIIVGDSLSDTGNIAKTLGPTTLAALPGPVGYNTGFLQSPYYNYQFSNGPIYANQLGTMLQASGTTTDLAVGGAFSGTYTVASPLTIGAATITGTNLSATLSAYLPSIMGQVQSLAGTSFGSRDLAVVYGGANDAFAALGAVAAQPSLTLPQITAAFTTTATTVATNISTEVATLAAMGVKNIVVPNLPALGLTPAFNSNPANAAAATSLSNGINQAVAVAMATLSRQLGINITIVDTNALISDMVANPSKYGLSNVTAECLPTGSAGYIPTGATACANPNSYLFWDTVHPTSGGSLDFGQYMTAILQGPTTVAAQGQIVQIATQSAIDSMSTRSDQLRLQSLFPDADLGANTATMGPDQKLGLYVAVNGGQGSRASEFNATGFHYTNSKVVFGADVKLLPHVVMGMIGDIGQTKATLSGGMGSDALNTSNIGLYTTAWGDHWFASGGAAYGFDNFNQLNRNTFVANQIAAATAGVKTQALYVKAGPVFNVGGVVLGPVIGFQNIYASIDGESEVGAVGMNQMVGAQHIRSTQWQFGAQANYALTIGGTTLVPGLQASWNIETAPSSRIVSTINIAQPSTTVLTTIGGQARDFARIAATLDVKTASWMTINAALAADQGNGRSDLAATLQARASF
ncbi:MAG: autotransporter domain-containing protein [Acetobacteraceae bacterium]|nr:autotransporter domain-containing protein [Acetobacteraceae bacterium]